MSDEQWKDIQDYEGVYQVSDKGRVRLAPRTRSAKSKKSSYPSVQLSKNNRACSVTIHKLVLETFVAPQPENMECRHKDGNPNNNNLENLSWCTHKENEADKVQHGTKGVGEKHSQAKLSEFKVKCIRILCDAGYRHQAIADLYGVSRKAIGFIAKRETWAHVA